MANSDAITPKQRKTIAALITCGTTEEAVQLSGVSRSTLERWFRLPEFSMALDEASDRLVDEHIRQLAAELQRNLRTMIELRDNPKVPAPTRLRAADNLERHLQSWTSIHVLERRIAALEGQGGQDGRV